MHGHGMVYADAAASPNQINTLSHGVQSSFCHGDAKAFQPPDGSR